MRAPARPPTSAAEPPATGPTTTSPRPTSSTLCYTHEPWRRRRRCRCPTTRSRKSSAASRCVCKAWRALVDDARGLLLPHELRGIFINYTDYGEPLLLARPSPGGFPRISGDLSYVPGFGHSYTHFINHCNGLLLCYGEFGYDDYYVVNPATRRWESFSSPRVNVNGRGDHAAYLVFDPAVSPHCEVFWIPYLSRPEEAVRPENVPAATFSLSGLFSLAMEGTDEEEEVLEELARPVPPPSMEQGLFPTRKLSLLARSRLGKPYDPYGLMEWPQSPCTLHVFSSRTRRWEERPFVREGEPVGMAKDARWDHFCVQYGVYWQGTLYVHCPGGFVMSSGSQAAAIALDLHRAVEVQACQQQLLAGARGGTKSMAVASNQEPRKPPSSTGCSAKRTLGPRPPCQRHRASKAPAWGRTREREMRRSRASAEHRRVFPRERR
ncbi:uncharacterized protein [Setaria viridis]|uniref:uncharacterized protein n=1 Tax=Setaria viridis TaxID=4556 RepID=UPI003B3B63C7